MDGTNEFHWMPLLRWHTLLERADAEGIRLVPIKRAKRLMYATSGQTGQIAYTVDEFGCTCRAGRNGVDCKHRALYLLVHYVRLVADYGYPPEIAEAETAGAEEVGS